MPALSFEVGAAFIIDDRATPVLASLSERFAGLQGQIDTLQERLAGLGTAIETGLNKVGTAFEAAVAQAKSASDQIIDAMNGAGAAAANTAREIEAVAAALGNVSRAAAEASAAGGGAGATAGGFDRDEVPRSPLALMSPTGEGAMIGAAAAAGGAFGGGAAASDWEYMGREGWQYRGRGMDVEGLAIGYGGGAGGRPPAGNPPLPMDAPYGPSPEARQRRTRSSHIVPLLEAGAVYEAMKSAASEEQSIDITLLRGFGIDPRTATPEQKQYLQNLARQGAVGTAFSESQVAAGEAVLAAPLGFRGAEGLKQFGSVFDVAVKAAEAASQLRFGTFEGTLTGAVEFAHQLQQYDAPGLTRSMNLLGAITESLPHGDMAREALVMGYAIPQARALGVDPNEAMTGIGFLQRAGLRNTVAATTFRQFLVGMLREGGPMTAHLSHEDREFRNALMMREDRGHGVTGRGNLHDQALINLGLMDRATHKLTVENAEGGIDVAKAFEKMQAASSRLNPVEFGRALYGAFGVRGENVGLIAEAMRVDPKTGTSLFGNYMNTVNSTAPLDEQLKMINISTTQQTGQMIARVADVGNAIGDTLLPSLRNFNAAVISAADHLYEFARGNPGTTAALAGGGIAATVIGGLMGLRHAAGGMLRGMFGWGAPDAAPGLIRSAVTGGLRGIGGFLEALPTLALLGLTGPAGGEDEAFSRQKNEEFLRSRGFNVPGQRPLPEHSENTNTTSPRAQAPDRMPPHQTASAPPQITVTVGPVTMNGVADEATFRNLLRQLEDHLRNALATATGPAQGTWVSPYEYGAPP